MKIDFQIDKMNTKQRVGGFILPLVMALFSFIFRRMITDYVKGQNLNMTTFSQFGGKNQRNLFTVTQTHSYMLVCLSFAILDNVLIIIFQLYRGQMDKNTQFILHNLLWVAFIELFFGIYVPVKHIILSRECLPGLWWNNRIVQMKKFYVSKQMLCPRRYVEPSTVVIQNAQNRNKKAFAYLRKSSRNKIRPTMNDTKPFTYKVDNLNKTFFITNDKNQ